MGRDDVRAYYDHLGEREWARLEAADGAVEFAVHTHAIAAHLPKGSRVLDLGGGPGRYTIWLVQRGHRVVLADLSPTLLTIAQRVIAAAGVGNRVEALAEADACDLSRWSAASFDAVVCLGPFYHLPDPADRERAAAELARVLRPDGLAFVALMPRYALLRRTIAAPAERPHLTDAAFLQQLIEDGVFLNNVPGKFTGGYGARPEDIAPFFARFGFSTLQLLASEGIAGDLQGALADLAAQDPPAYQAALALIVRTAADPSILGMSNHVLYIGRKAGV